MTKRIISFIFIFSFFLTVTAQASSSTAIIKSDTPLFTTSDETETIATLPNGTTVTITERSEIHSHVTADSIEGYVRNENLVERTSRFIVKETYTVDANKSKLTFLPFGTSVEVYDLGDDADYLRIDSNVFVARDSLGDAVPALAAETRYVKQATPVFSTPEAAKSETTLEAGQRVDVYGQVDGYYRLKSKDGYRHIAANATTARPIKTGSRYILSNAPIYQDASKTTVVGSLKRGQLVSIYGTEGTLSRIFTGGAFVFVETNVTALKMPTYKKTGQRYVQVDSPLYTDPDRSKQVGAVKKEQLVSIYGTEGLFTRLFTKGEFVYIETKALGTKKPTYAKTGQRYLLKQTPVYERAAKSKTVATFKRGQLVNIYGTEGAYTRVYVNGAYRFVQTNMTSTKKPLPYDSTGSRYVKYNNVEVYAAASTGKQVTQLKRGQVVETYGTSGYYTRVRVSGQFRFVATAYLSLNKPVAKPKAGTVFYTQVDATPYFSTDVAHVRPAGTLNRGTRLVGIRSIDADFWQVRLPSGKTTYVLNPYIATTKPKSVKQTKINPVAHYATTKRTPFYANPNDKSPIGYLDTNRRVYPRLLSGDSYLLQYNWSPVYVKVADISVKKDPLLAVRSNSQQERMITAAAKHLGTPYTWGSQSPLSGGFDCSGLIHYATNQAGKIGGRTNVAGYWNSQHFKNKRTSISSGRRGDIVFFAGTYKSGPSHIGIMLDNEFFIHAGGEMLQINSIHDPQWRSNFLGYKSL